MYQAGAEHELHVLHHDRVIFTGLFCRHGHVVQTRRYVTVVIGNQFHQQYAVETAKGGRDACADGGETIKGVYFRVLPRRFLLVATEL